MSNADLAMSVIPLERQDWFINLVEECKDLVTETEFTSRWTLVEGYHGLGSRILQENNNFERAKVYGEGICNAVAESLKKRPRTIYYAIQFAKVYPDLNLLPEGKDTSWHKVINKYLTDGTEKKVVKKVDLYRMIQGIKELLQTEWMKSHSVVVNGDPDGRTEFYKDQCEFIRYLQDQVNKITGELNES